MKFLLFPTKLCFANFCRGPEIRKNRSGGCRDKCTEYAAVAHLVAVSYTHLLGSGAITEIFGTVQGHFKDLTKEQLHDADYAKRVLPFAGEVYICLLYTSRCV